MVGDQDLLVEQHHYSNRVCIQLIKQVRLVEIAGEML